MPFQVIDIDTNPLQGHKNSEGFLEHNNFKGEYDIQKVEGFTSKFLCELEGIS